MLLLVFVYALLVICGLGWVGAVGPMLLPESVRGLLFALWDAGCAIVLITLIVEWTWYRRLAQRLAGYQKIQREDPGGAQEQFASGGSGEKDRSHHQAL